MKCLTGYLIVDGVRVQVDFEVPITASKEQIDSAFVDALSQKIDINFLSIN